MMKQDHGKKEHRGKKLASIKANPVCCRNASTTSSNLFIGQHNFLPHDLARMNVHFVDNAELLQHVNKTSTLTAHSLPYGDKGKC